MYPEMFVAAEQDVALTKNPNQRAERQRMITTLKEAYRTGGAPAFRQKLLEFQLEDRRSRDAAAFEIAETDPRYTELLRRMDLPR